jgi:AraC family transcriptional regulator of adaptative response/methylated-DNA-[protein]-cysteine methyltransferase
MNSETKKFESCTINQDMSVFPELLIDMFKQLDDNQKLINTIYIVIVNTPIGQMYAASIENQICMLEFTDRRMLKTEILDLSRLLKAKYIIGYQEVFSILSEQLTEYFAGKRNKFDLPIYAPGTDFQRKVWVVLMEIPLGETRSYEKQAEILQNPDAIRAVARANGMNRISIIIPCHRVIGKDGTLVGYGGGLWRKKWLLDFESKNEILF